MPFIFGYWRLHEVTEIDLFGVYIALISVMLAVAWMVTISLRRALTRFGLPNHIWHPALGLSIFFMILSEITLVVGA